MNTSPYNFILVPIRVFVVRILIILGYGVLLYAVFFVHESEESSRTDTLYLVDTSHSMSVSDIIDDSRVLSSRLDAAKELLQTVHNDSTRSGLMTFAGDARLQLPLSSDPVVWDTIVEALTPVSQRSPTDIESALLSVSTLYGDKPIHVVVITDGESTTDVQSLTGITFAPMTRITLIGVGTVSGGKIVNNYDGQGYPVYKKYKDQDVISTLDTDALSRLQDLYNTELFFLTEKKDIPNIVRSLTEYRNRNSGVSFQEMLVYIALIIVFMGILLTDYRRR